MITFDAPQEKSLLKTVEKRKNYGNPFKEKLHHFSHNELSSANTCSLGMAKILLYGKGLTKTNTVQLHTSKDVY